MPSVFLDRLPMPSLKTYTSISIILFSIAANHAIKKSSDTNWKPEKPINFNVEAVQEPLGNLKNILQALFTNQIISRKLYIVAYVFVDDYLCAWSLLNLIHCLMVLIGNGIQKVVFGKLRAVEKQHMNDKFWNFVFYKFIFIFGVMNIQHMDEVVIWCSWFSTAGAFHLLSQLCKDRFEYLSFSPTTPTRTHISLFSLIFFILGVSTSLCTLIGFYAPLNTFFFMTAEWALVIFRTLYVLVRYIIHLYDITHEGIWEKRGFYIYYSEFIYDLASLFVDFIHHVHMIYWRNIFLSVASLVICMQLRFLVNEMQLRLLRHKNYLRVSRHMENHYPLATKEEIEANSDDCAICWDKMESARKLPCGHMFHTSCLHSWLEQVTNCPTCRTPLAQMNSTNSPTSDINRNILGQDAQPRTPNQTRNHFFHFDGSRYVSWFPSFSVEVTHTTLLGERQQMIPTSQLDSMVRQVLQMFPHMPYNLIMEDLMMTRSIELTVENILEERLTAPTTSHFPPTPTHSSSLTAAGPAFNLRSHEQRNSSSSPSSLLHRFPSIGSGGEHSLSTISSALSNLSSANEELSVMRGAEGGRFSKSSHEREQMLSSRKSEMLRKAKNKYISRIQTHTQERSNNASGSTT